jgi:phytoene/squalene synthetase
MLAAERVLKEYQPGIWWVARLTGLPGMSCFQLVYSYFRWADDRVDGPEGDAGARQRFARRQMSWIESGYGAGPEGTPQEEALAVVLQQEPELQDTVLKMWAALAFDASREAGKRLAGEAIEAQISRIGNAFAEGLHRCFGKGATPKRLKALCRAATVIHQLRDLEEDEQRGFSNIPAEVVRTQEASWARSRLELAALTLRAGLKEGGQRQHPGYRLLVWALCRRYLRVAAQIKISTLREALFQFRAAD